MTREEQDRRIAERNAMEARVAADDERRRLAKLDYPAPECVVSSVVSVFGGLVFMIAVVLTLLILFASFGGGLLFQ